MKPSEKNIKADLLMAFELFNDIIAVVGMAELTEKICEQLRELSGSKTVMLIRHDETSNRHTLAGISPARRRGMFSESDLEIFCAKQSKKPIRGTTAEQSDPCLRSLLEARKISSLLCSPLVIGQDIIGSVILLDPPEISRLNELEEIVKFLATPMALALKNAIIHDQVVRQADELRLLNENLEQKVLQRTNELEQSEKRYRVLFENSAEGILVVNPQTTEIVMANPTVCAMFGYTLPEILQLMVSDLHPEEEKARVKNEFEAIIQKQSESVAAIKCCKKKGGIFFADIKASWVSLDDKEYLVGFFVDITEKQVYQKTLERQDRLDSLGILAGGIAHDFNNLLGAIYGNIELSLTSIKDSTAIAFLDTALATIDRASGLTSQLLTFARGGSPIRKIETIEQLLKETVLFSLSGSKTAASFSFASELSACLIDRNQIAQVIDNLVINARQAMPDGGAVAIMAWNCSIGAGEHPVLKPGSYVRVEVADNGPGMPQETLSRIFDPFFTTKKTGNGLGLTVCYSIMRKHDGCIEVFSCPGKGARFVLHLPAAVKSVPEVSEPQAVGQKYSGIALVMDDEMSMRKLMDAMLKNAGFVPVCFADGKAVLDWLAENDSSEIACMFFDLTIPGGMGGLQLAAEVRSRGMMQPVYLISGYSGDDVMADPLKCGFTGSLQKPFLFADLMNLLNATFTHASPQQ